MSIYNVNNWAIATRFDKNGITKYSNNYYYSLIDNNIGNTPSLNNSNWDGMTTYNGIVKPKFIWKPSYNSTTNVQPKAKTINYGDGYTQRIPDGVNTILLKLNLIFDLRTRIEADAICHFLYQRKGTESFVFTPDPPFDLAKLFICAEFDPTFVFYDNFSIKAIFEENCD